MNHRSGNHRALRALACALTVTTVACGDFEDDELAARVLELEHAHELGTTGFTTTGPWTSTGSTSTGSTGTGSTGTSSSTGGTWGSTTDWDDTGAGTTWSSTTDWDDTGSDDTGSTSTGGTCEVTFHTLNAFVEGSDLHARDGNNPPPNYPPGWIDRIELQTGTQCNFQNWKDSDGVDPETPGCHTAYESENCEVQTNDVFGEQCEDGDILIETNPGKDVCHSHAIGPGGVGVGHPDRFSCNAYCTAKYGLPGECRTSENTCGNGVASAYCLCGC